MAEWTPDDEWLLRWIRNAFGMKRMDHLSGRKDLLLFFRVKPSIISDGTGEGKIFLTSLSFSLTFWSE
jgi:hypothetical protein